MKTFLRGNLLIWITAGVLLAPGAIHKSFATPGDLCETTNECDVCNQETCVANRDDTQSSQCQNGNQSFDPNAEPTPHCPINQKAPGCLTTCKAVPNDEDNLIPECSPNDSFCDAISGGLEMSDCRSATCTDDSEINPANPFPVAILRLTTPIQTPTVFFAKTVSRSVLMSAVMVSANNQVKHLPNSPLIVVCQVLQEIN
jgi:hypothetical protein